MAKLKLPITPYTDWKAFTRGGKDWRVFYGINENGHAFMWFEEVERLPGNIERRWVPTEMRTKFLRGANVGIQTYWQPELYAGGVFLPGTDGPDEHMDTNAPDLITFTASLGIHMVPSIINGFIRAILDHDDYPLFVPDMTTGKMVVRVDSEEDQLAPPKPRAYEDNHPLEYIEDAPADEPAV